MSGAKTSNIFHENTLKIFQPFYNKPLTKDDTIEIKNNLINLLKVLNENKRNSMKQGYKKS